MVENRFRRVQVERKNQHFAECYLENNSPRCFCEAQKSKAGLVPRAPLVAKNFRPADLDQSPEYKGVAHGEIIKSARRRRVKKCSFWTVYKG